MAATCWTRPTSPMSACCRPVRRVQRSSIRATAAPSISASNTAGDSLRLRRPGGATDTAGMKVTRQQDERGTWEMAFADPAPPLAGLIDTYIGYDERNTAFTRRHELPGLNAVLIVNLGDPITIVDTAGYVIPVRSGDGFGA